MVRKSIDFSFVHTLVTLSKGTLAYIRHVFHTSRRCANQRHATSDRSVFLSYYPILATKKYLEERHARLYTPHIPYEQALREPATCDQPDRSVSLSYYRKDTNRKQRTEPHVLQEPKRFTCVLVMSKKCPVYDVLSLRRE
jgi:hypothetical protein